MESTLEMEEPCAFCRLYLSCGLPVRLLRADTMAVVICSTVLL